MSFRKGVIEDIKITPFQFCNLKSSSIALEKMC